MEASLMRLSSKAAWENSSQKSDKPQAEQSHTDQCRELLMLNDLCQE